jgi:hypothetical protein
VLSTTLDLRRSFEVVIELSDIFAAMEVRRGVFLELGRAHDAAATVIVCGWESAKIGPLQACARLYKDLGCHLLLVSVLLSPAIHFFYYNSSNLL